MHTEFLGEYEVYQVLLKKYQEYQSTLQSLGSEELLLQAFELGELSFIQYYIELSKGFGFHAGNGKQVSSIQSRIIKTSIITFKLQKL